MSEFPESPATSAEQPARPAGGHPFSSAPTSAWAGPLDDGSVNVDDERLWGLLAPLSVPFFGFVGPLLVYLVFKDRSSWLKDTSVEALNFSILYTIALVASSILVVVVIGAVLLPLVFIGALVLCLLAALAANRHELYRYPINWRLVT